MKRKGTDAVDSGSAADSSGQETGTARSGKGISFSEGPYRTLFNSLTQAVFVHPFREEGFGRFIEVNDAACERYGYSREEFLQLSPVDITQPSQARSHATRDHRDLLAREGRLRFEATHLTKDGDAFPVQITSNVVMLGQEPVILAVVQDLTDRKRVQEALTIIQAGVGARTGKAFFESIVVQLSKALGADYAFVGQFFEKENTAVRTIAFAAEGTVANPFEYDLRGTPCENMAQEGHRTIPSEAQAAYPAAHLLKRLEIEGWVGTPLMDSAGEPIGVLVAMFRNPLTAPEEAGSILEIFAARTGAELERLGQREKLLSLEKAVESSGEAIFMTDPQGVFTYVNPGFTRLYGYTPGEVIGKETPRVLKSGQLPPEVYVHFWDTLQAGGMMEGEILNRTKDGRFLTVDGSASPILGESGEVTGFLGIQRDVSARRAAEDALKAGEEHLRSIFRVAPAGIGVVRDRMLVEVNDLCCRMVGRDSKELLGQSSRILYPTQEEFEWVGTEKYDQISRKGTGTVETRWIRADGQVIDVLLSSTPIDPDDFSRGVTFTALDITTRKRSEAALKSSEERFRAAIEQSHDAVSIFFQGRFDLVNERFYELTGYSRKELQDPGFHHLEIFAPESRDFIEGNTKLRAQGERPPEMQSFSFQKPTGEKVRVEASVKEIDYRGGKAVLSSIRDVSEQQELEDRLRQAQKMESVGRLSGGVAHDLNNLLTPILGYSELLADGFSLDDRRREFAEQITEAGNRARDLIRQLLAFSRRQTLAVSNLDLSRLVEDFEKLLRRTLREDVDVRLELGTSLPPIRADRVQVEQVLMNLVINAQEAMPTGGTLTIRTEISAEGELEDPEVDPGAFVLLSVRDTGHGMDSETLEKLFEPFFTTKEGGTGLGMATVYGIVTQHGGSIQVDSRLGEGTEIRSYFPVGRGYVAAPEPRTDADTPDEKGTETILVVEDEAGARRLVVDLLRRNGYRVLAAPNGTRCLELLQDHQGPLDLLLTDVVLPGMDGRALVRKVQETFPDIKTLFMSGYSDEVITRHGILEDGLAFLQKPFSVREISAKIREVLDG